MAPDEPTNGTPVTWRDLGNLGVMKRLDVHGERINELESWKDQATGVMSFAKFAFGASIVGTISSIVAIWVALR